MKQRVKGDEKSFDLNLFVVLIKTLLINKMFLLSTV